MEIGGALISPFVGQLITSVLDTAEHAQAFDNQFLFLRMRLASIKAILEANQNNDQEVDGQTIDSIQLALSELRKLMYEADDVWTDCFIRREYGSNGFFSNFLPHNFFFRLQTVKNIEDINRRIEVTSGILHQHLRSPTGGNNNVNDAEQDSYDQLSESDESKPDDAIFGVDDDLKMIESWILSSDYGGLRKIGIVGMGGLGKTTIAKIIFNDPAVRSHFDKKIFVTVSQTFSKELILGSIAKQLGEESCAQKPEESSGSSMLSKIVSRLKDSSCLIILDDIWHQEQNLRWLNDKFFSPLSETRTKRSCIIITTRDDNVATDIRVNEIHKPTPLKEEDGWSLFEKHAFSTIKKQGLDVKSYEKLGREIVKKCNGLPLAIKTIGGLLGSTSSTWDWDDIFKGFCEHNFTEQNKLVMNSLNLSYKALPSHLKRCLLCFSVYPEDYVIPSESLIHWWIAEGLIQAEGRKTALEMGFVYLSKLVSRCLVEAVDRHGHDTGRFYSCKMHDMVRDLTIIMANKEKIRRADDGQSVQDSILEARWFWCTTERQAKSLLKSPGLRALLMLRMNKSKLDKGLSSLTSLRVLDLSHNMLDRDSLKNLFSWISILKRLACLNLSESKYLVEVPDSICKLQNLQFLILTECTKLSKLSPSVTYLKRLIVLNLGSCESLLYLPLGLGRLTQLQELYGLQIVEHQKRRSCQLVELEDLVNLRVLHIKLSKDSEITERQCEVLSKHKNLKVLSIDFDTKGEEQPGTIDMLNKLFPPAQLEELNLRQYHHENLPAWVSPERLPNLLHLQIEDGNIAKFPTTTAYTSLRRLYLNLLPYLQADWDELVGKMPSLRYAEISSCPGVKNFPGDPNSNPRIWRRPPGNK